MAANTALTVPADRSSFRSLWLLFAGLLAIALYINLSKVMFGSRYFILLADLALLMLVAGVLTYRLLKMEPFCVIEWLAGAFMLVGLVEIFNPNTPDVMTGVEGYRRTMFQMLALFVAIVAVRQREDAIRLLKVLAVVALPTLLYGIKQFFGLSALDAAIIETNTASPETWMLFGQVRAFSIFNGPFHLGLFSGFSFWVATALLLETRQKLYIGLAILAVAACAASLTRGSILALLISIPLVLLYVYRRHRARIILVVATVISLAVGSLYLARSLNPSVESYVDSISSLERITEDRRLETRLDGYRLGLQVIGTNPFGIGMGSAGDAMEHHFEPRGKQHITSHNLFLRIALETGWLGLLLFVMILVVTLRAVNTHCRAGDSVLAVALLGPLAIVSITGISGSTIGAYPVNLLFWAICGALVGLAGQREPGTV